MKEQTYEISINDGFKIYYLDMLMIYKFTIKVLYIQ